jgi:hypothetical protein
MHLVKEHPTILEHVALVPQRAINAYPLKDVSHMSWYPGDLVVHIAGCWVNNQCNDQWVEYMAKRTPAPKPEPKPASNVAAAPAKNAAAAPAKNAAAAPAENAAAAPVKNAAAAAAAPDAAAAAAAAPQAPAKQADF